MRLALAALVLLAACVPAPIRDKGLEPSLSTAAALARALEPRRVALVVGVDAYDDPLFPDLRHAGDGFEAAW